MFISTDILLTLPVVLPLITTVVLLIVWKWVYVQHIIQVLAGIFNLSVSVMILAEVMNKGYLTIQIGGWEAPYGITFYSDMLGALMLVATHAVALATSVFSIKGMDRRRLIFGYYPLYYVMLAGIGGIVLTGDIFNMYVWIELMLISSFILLALGGRKKQLEGTIKYTMMNLFASFFLLLGIGLMYGKYGSLNLAKLAQVIPETGDYFLLYLISLFFLLSLGIKTAIFPLYFWLPASYPTSPGPVAAIFGGLLAKVGFYALIRIFTLIFVSIQTEFQFILLIISAFTMLTAVLAAVAHRHFLKILSVHVVSQVGYLLMGMGLFSIASYAGAVFFLIHIIIVKTNLFLIAGISKRVGTNYDIYKSGGQFNSHRFLAILFLINALSLAGVPPLSGFWGKFFLIKAALDSGFYLLAGAGLITGMLTLISMTKIWKEVFWKKRQMEEEVEPLSNQEKLSFYGPVILLTVLVLWLSFQPGIFYDLSEAAAKQISDPETYIKTILK